MEKPVFSEQETELIDYLNVIWKRKWMIIIPTLFLVLIVFFISFFLPPKWEVDAIIVPSKFLIQTEGGQFEEVLVIDPRQITGQINVGTYNNLIADELDISIKEFPELRAENVRDTKLVRVSLREKDVEKAKLILHSLFNHLKEQLDAKVEIEIKGIDSRIKSEEIEKLRIQEEIKANKNKLSIVRQRKNEIEKEMKEIRNRIEKLEKEQLLYLKKENKGETESLAMLLYSNEIQRSLMNHNTLNELLNSKKMAEENINLEILNEENEIEQIKNEINTLNERKGRIDKTQLIKKPTPTINPVSPNKKVNVAIAGIFSLMIFTIFAFFLEYLKKQK